MKETAQNYFHGAERFNCAQAVLKTFQPHFDVSDELIAEHKKSGGGRAEENLCGAIYATELLLDCDDTIKKIHNQFRDIAGNLTCRELKREGKVGCRECVGIAAELIHNEIDVK